MPALRLFLLGPLDIRFDGQPLPRPPTLKSQSLFAYLALHRQRPQPRDRLADLFWGDRPERRARRSLTTALWHIRRCLPDEDWLLSDVHSAQLDPAADLWLDVAEFEALAARSDLGSLQSAVALYRGDFMDGFYDDWVLNQRYRVETLFAEALARLMVGLEAEGKPDRALTTALRLLQHDPLREDAHRLAMRALCRLGQRNAALEQYRRCRETVRQELGAEPMVETTELYQAILDGRFQVGPAVAPPAAVEPVLPAGQNPLDPVVHGPLVGRDSEMAFLQARYEEARAGHGGLVLVHGEAGVGKTRLVEEFAGRLHWQAVRTLWGRCYEFERLLPYQPIGEALQAVMAPGELIHLPSWVLSALARLVPELSERLDEPSASLAIPPEEEQAHLFEGVARFLAQLSTGGALVLVLDDLHWATESTLGMLHYLARHLADQRVLMVGTLRPEAIGAGHPLQSFQRQLGREGLVRSLSLAGLSPPAVEALVVEMSGCGPAVGPLARRLVRETEGNPFFLTEIIKALFEVGSLSLQDGAWSGDFAGISEAALPLPVGVSEAIQARVGRLDPEASQALGLAAVLGREFDFDLLCAAWHRGEEATLEALEALLRRRFIREGSGVLGRDYAFHHHLIREVVYAGIPLRHRRHLHAQAGQAMEALVSDVEGVAGELAFHFVQGRLVDGALVPQAIRYLLLSGDQARLAYAHREAIEYYTQALALQQEGAEHEGAGRTLMKLGLVYHTTFDFAEAHQAFEDGFAQWQRAGSRGARIGRPPAPHPLRIRWRSPYTLDPALSGDYVSSLVIDQLFRGLVSTGPELEVVPEMAQRWQVLEGGRRYRFYLRPAARWSDGTPLTARDFEYAWKRVLDPATGAAAPGLLVVKGARAFRQGGGADPDCVGVRALDDRTLDVELEEPVSHFLYLLADVNTYPVPPHVVAAHGAAWTGADTLVTNGPFTLEAWDSGEGMTLARNPLYANPGRGNVGQVDLHFPRDLSIPLEEYVRGELDVLTLTDAAVHEGDRIRRQFAAEYVSAPWLFTLYLAFDVSRPPFDDVRLRQALALAADREHLANVILRGMYTPATGGLVPPGMPGHSPGIGLPYHPGRAQELLAAAGARLSTLEALTVPPVDPLITEQLQAWWLENLGLRVTWEVLDWPEFSGRLAQDPSPLHLLAWFASVPDPGDFLGADSIRDYTGWTNQAHEELLAKAGHTLNQEARIELLRQADQILVHDAPVVPLFYGRQHLLVKPWVTSFPISALNRWFWKDTVIEPH
jgi:ABC-type oligopeptide transport system substrate-binding subunit/DNA-binding SARP family transcriptional activator